MPKANNNKSQDDEVAKLKAQLEVSEQARVEAEQRADTAEAESDMSIKQSVANEAMAVAHISTRRQPVISTMPGGTTRIDF